MLTIIHIMIVVNRYKGSAETSLNTNHLASSAVAAVGVIREISLTIGGRNVAG
jgi:hypothetical protein